MPKNTNSASRLNSILSAAKNQNSEASAVNNWCIVFGITENNDHRRALKVSERLYWVHQEIEQVRSQMKSLPYSESLYEPALSSCEAAISTVNLGSPWKVQRGQLPPEVFLALQFCAEILPDEESEIEPTLIQEITDKVAELEKILESTSMSAALRSLIQHHIELIRVALSRYPITGAKALRESAQTALGEMVSIKDTIQEEQSNAALQSLAALWKRINTATDVAIKIDRTIDVAQRAWAFLDKMI